MSNLNVYDKDVYFAIYWLIFDFSVKLWKDFINHLPRII